MQRIVNLNRKIQSTEPNELEKQIEINRQKKEKRDAERKKRNDDIARAYKLPTGKKPPPSGGKGGGGGNKQT